MKKINLLAALFILSITFAACQPATPLPPVTASLNAEFTLAPDQTASIAGTDLTIRLIGVAGDERCPSEIECAISGPVSISLSVQKGNGSPANINLQTFTDNNGRAPEMEFEGIHDRTTYEGFAIRISGVWPYPVNLIKKIKDSEYRVTLVVNKQ